MSCFNPNRVFVANHPLTGEIKTKFLGPARDFDPREFGSIDDLADSEKGTYTVLVPCGKCLGCQIDYSREWANRMIIELNDNPNAVFLTLTYNDENLKISSKGFPTLDKRDLQLWWKRLRKAFPGRTIRFFVAGEYGPKTWRPHYHAIVYGLSLEDFPDRYVQRYNKLKQPLWTSPRLEAIWAQGFILFSPVTWRTCAYVARYVLKKHLKGDKEIVSRETLPEFTLSSRRPGIGLLHAEDYVLSGNSHFSFDCHDGVREISLPKSMIRNLKRYGNCLDKLNEICYNRSKDASARLASNLLLSEMDFNEYLLSCEKRLKDKIRLLPERTSI